MPWRGPEEPGEFPTLGYEWIDWIENTLPIPDGPHQGEPFRLYDEQAMHLLHLGRINPDAEDGDDSDAMKHSGSQVVRGQKWGKDPLLAAFDLLLAFGPCRFGGWDANGEPVGKPHPTPWVFVAALNDDQANNTWLPIKYMVENSELVDLAGVEVTLDLIRLPCGNPLERLTTTAFGRLGGRFTGGSLTENGLMTDTISSQSAGKGKRSPLGFARTLIRSVNGMGGQWMAATNTWDPSERSHAQRIHEQKSPRIYDDARISRGKVDLTDDDKLRDELLYLYGDAAKENGGHVSVKSLMADCRDTEVHGEAEIRRFFLSEIIVGEDQLATKEHWASLARGRDHADHDPLMPGESIALGFDGSRSRDATVLTACRLRDRRIFHLRTWLPAWQADRQFKVDRLAVDKAVHDTFTAYDVRYLYADPFKWQDYLDRWAGKYPKRVVEFPTNEERRMDRAVVRFTQALKDGVVTHDGDETVPAGEETLTQHVTDTVIKKGKIKPAEREDDEGKPLQHYLGLAKRADGVRIDGSVSAVLAVAAAGQAIEDGALEDEAAPSPFGLFGD
jgi:hypothetical protein